MHQSYIQPRHVHDSLIDASASYAWRRRLIDAAIHSGDGSEQLLVNENAGRKSHLGRREWLTKEIA